MSTVKKSFIPKFMHIFIAINCNLLHKYGQIVNVFTDFEIMSYYYVYAVIRKVVGVGNELYYVKHLSKMQ